LFFRDTLQEWILEIFYIEDYKEKLQFVCGFVTADSLHLGCDAVYLGSYGAMSWGVVVTTDHL